MRFMVSKLKIPKNVESILKKIKKNHHELGEFCINNAIDSLKANGYSNPQMWAAVVMPTILGELEYVEDRMDIEEWLLELDGMERNVVESLYDDFKYLGTTVKKAKQKDIKDTLVFSISNALENLDRNKYKKLYG